MSPLSVWEDLGLASSFSSSASMDIANRIPSELLARLDAWVATQPDPKPSGPEALRRLLDATLTPPRESRGEWWLRSKAFMSGSEQTMPGNMMTFATQREGCSYSNVASGSEPRPIFDQNFQQLERQIDLKWASWHLEDTADQIGRWQFRKNGLRDH
jgi:hypothetical protein